VDGPTNGLGHPGKISFYLESEGHSYFQVDIGNATEITPGGIPIPSAHLITFDIKK
jgi:hypothetical protein